MKHRKLDDGSFAFFEEGREVFRIKFSDDIPLEEQERQAIYMLKAGKDAQHGPS